MTEYKCDYYNCRRPGTRMDGWGTVGCEGHFIIFQANKDTHGPYGITAKEYRKRILPAKEWLDANPNPEKETE